MKIFAFLAVLLLNFVAGVPSSAGELSPASVAELIAKEEGYRLFRFSAQTAQKYQLLARFNGSENVQNTLNIPAIKECIVAVRLGKKNTLEAVRVYYENGSVSMAFPSGHFPKFNGSLSQSEIQLNDPFLTLRSAKGEVELLLRPRKS